MPMPWLIGAALLSTIVASPLESPPDVYPPDRGGRGPDPRFDGRGLMVGGGLLMGAATGTQVAALTIGGHIGRPVMLPASVGPYVGGMAMMFVGAGLRGRLDGWRDPTKRGRAEAAFRAGWAMFGVGLAVVGVGVISLAFWPSECDDEMCATRAYPGYVAVEVITYTSPSAIAVGGTLGTWGLRYQKWRAWRDWRNTEVVAGPGSFSLRF